MDTSLIAYLNESAQELLVEAESGFPSMAEELYKEAAELMNLAAKLTDARATKSVVPFSKAA